MVEVAWLPGCEPSVAAQEGARDFLARYARPARGVRVERLGETPGGTACGGAAPVPPDTDLWRMARIPAPPPAAAGTERVRLLFVPRLEADASGRGARGRAFASEALAVIGRDAAREAAFLGIGPDEVERFVVQHELGHLLGLVSSPAHARDGHCTHPDCILYAGPDLRAFVANFWRGVAGRLPDSLDVECEADLARLRAEAAAR